MSNFKDLIIGGASNYTWDHLKYWINSIKLSGFEGDIVLVVTNMKRETIDKLSKEGVILFAYGKETEDGFVNDSKSPPHVERFLYIWNFLDRNKDNYRFVTVTDTRDVIFQTNPTVLLEKLCTKEKKIIASWEGMLYKDEPWNNNNLLEAFGPFFHNHFQNMKIANVGTIAGRIEYVSDLLLMLFQMSMNRPIPIVDQVVFNFLINQQPYVDSTRITDNQDNWAIQLGVTEKAIEAGAGDIGMWIKNDPSKMTQYRDTYKDKQPIIKDHVVMDEEGNKFCLVHQWDRIPSLKEEIENYYGDNECPKILTFTT